MLERRALRTVEGPPQTRECRQPLDAKRARTRTLPSAVRRKPSCPRLAVSPEKRSPDGGRARPCGSEPQRRFPGGRGRRGRGRPGAVSCVRRARRDALGRVAWAADSGLAAPETEHETRCTGTLGSRLRMQSRRKRGPSHLTAPRKATGTVPSMGIVGRQAKSEHIKTRSRAHAHGGVGSKAHAKWGVGGGEVGVWGCCPPLRSRRL